MAQPNSLPVREGELLAGKYRVERVLGEGGMGIVVAAHHETLDHKVAIKFLREEALGNQEAVARFLREARAAAKLKSEHAAKVLDVGTLASGAPYMVMEFLEGSDLAAVLGDRGPIPVDQAADWVLQACEALAEAHAAGIIHRDLKPHNLFLARTVGGASKVKVLDFGVSKSIGVTSTGGGGALTRTRTMLGSPLYMSPEQMRSSRDVDARSDVWALGVVLFELLTQRWPFEAETMPELCLKVVSEPPLPLAALRPDAPAAMVAIVERCLDKAPDKRFANAAELASALEPFALPTSRITAERARLAMGVTTRPNRDVPTSTGSATLPSVEAPARSASPRTSSKTSTTPAAWDSDRQPAVAERRGRGRAIVVAGAGVAVAAALGFVVLRGHGPAPAWPASSMPAPPAVAASAPASAAAAPVLPAPTLEPGVDAAVAASPAPAAPTSSQTPRPVPRGPAVRVPPSGKPQPPVVKDDDIPAQR
jgi:serine/threonine-protein kinase